MAGGPSPSWTGRGSRRSAASATRSLQVFTPSSIPTGIADVPGRQWPEGERSLRLKAITRRRSPWSWPPFFVKIDVAEAAGLLNGTVDDWDAVAEAARIITRLGAERAMVTRGALG